MKRFYLFTITLSVYFIFTLAGLSAQGYHPFIEEGKIWADMTTFPDIQGGTMSIWTDFYKFDGGDTIDGKYYHFLYICEEDPSMTDWNLTTYQYREDSNKVYRGSWPWPDVIIYDFNLEPGDEFCIESYCDHVTAVDEVQVNNEFRKRIYFNSTDDIWIEGLGSLFSTFNPLKFHSIMPNTFELLCVNDTNGQLYQNPYFNSCYVDTILTGNQEFKNVETKVSVYPNPCKEKCTIRFNDVEGSTKILCLTEAAGNIVFKCEIQTDCFTFLTKNIKPGLYLLKITCNRTTFNERIIIQ